MWRLIRVESKAHNPREGVAEASSCLLLATPLIVLKRHHMGEAGGFVTYL